MTTQPEWKQAIRDHIAWCRAERDAALAQIAFFTTGGAKALIQNGDTPPQDITEGVLKHGRAVAEKMGSIIAAYEYLS
jgi:hypothetical protein